MQENSKKHTTDSASSGRNRKDNSQRSNRKSTGGGTESPISGKGDKNASASNTATKSKHLTSTAKTGLAMSNGCESSSSSGIGSSSSRLSSSGGSSDAVDTCDTNTTTSAVTSSNHHPQEAPRVPELHPEHGLQLEAGSSGGNSSRQPKEALSRRSSCKVDEGVGDESGSKMATTSSDNSPGMAVKQSSLKKKRKKRFDKNAVVSRDCSPNVPASEGPSSTGSRQDKLQSGSKSNHSNASTRFSCEAGPRIPKR